MCVILEISRGGITYKGLDSGYIGTERHQSFSEEERTKCLVRSNLQFIGSVKEQ